MEISNNETLSRFETEIQGHQAFLTYKLKGNSLALLHTDVASELEGRGVGSSLARFALEYARERGLKVLPYCRFVSGYIEKHPEYAGIVRTPGGPLTH